jgi:hypothetical protein
MTINNPTPMKVCHWQLDDYHGCYDTECGETYCFEESGPLENHYRYCPGCGHSLRVVEQPAEVPTEDE